MQDQHMLCAHAFVAGTVGEGGPSVHLRQVCICDGMSELAPPHACAHQQLYTQPSYLSIGLAEVMACHQIMARHQRMAYSITCTPPSTPLANSGTHLNPPPPRLHAGELLDTLPPGVDEMVAIANVVQFIKGPDYAHFTRIIFDTAPTGHTLRLLTLPDFLDASVGAPAFCPRSLGGSGRRSCLARPILHAWVKVQSVACARWVNRTADTEGAFVIACVVWGPRQGDTPAPEAGGCGRLRQGLLRHEEGAGLRGCPAGAGAGAWPLLSCCGRCLLARQSYAVLAMLSGICHVAIAAMVHCIGWAV